MASLQDLAAQLLGGQSAQAQGATEQILGLLNHPQVGGLTGLIQKFKSAGLDHLISGWVSTGPNPPATPQHIEQALGSEPIAAYAQKLGIPQGQAAGLLAQLLPHAVDHLTPNGEVPQGGFDLQSALGMLKGALPH